jgi:hypothetical protein
MGYGAIALGAKFWGAQNSVKKKIIITTTKNDENEEKWPTHKKISTRARKEK